MFVHLADCWVRATHAELPSPPSHPSPPPPSSTSPPFHSFPPPSPPSSPPSPNLYSSSHHPTSVSPPSSSPASFTPSPLFSFHTLPPSIPSPLYSPSSSSPPPYLCMTFQAAKHWHGCVFAIQLHFMAALFSGFSFENANIGVPLFSLSCPPSIIFPTLFTVTSGNLV